MDVKDCLPSLSIALTFNKDGHDRIFIVAPHRQEKERFFDLQEAFELMSRKLIDDYRFVSAEAYIYLFPKCAGPAQIISLVHSESVKPVKNSIEPV